MSTTILHPGCRARRTLWYQTTEYTSLLRPKRRAFLCVFTAPRLCASGAYPERSKRGAFLSVWCGQTLCAEISDRGPVGPNRGGRLTFNRRLRCAHFTSTARWQCRHQCLISTTLVAGSIKLALSAGGRDCRACSLVIPRSLVTYRAILFNIFRAR